MSKQTTLHTFIKKPQKKSPRPSPRPSPRRSPRNPSPENSADTVRLSEDENAEWERQRQEQIKIQRGQAQRVAILTCGQLILLTPACLITYPEVRRRLEKLEIKYSREEVLEFVAANVKAISKSANIRHLQELDDDQFWNLSLPRLLTLLLAELPKLVKVQLLRAGSQANVELTRLQILIILFAMFLGIMPIQSHEDLVSFGELMTLRDNEYNPKKAECRRQKLLCIIAYFKTMASSQNLLTEVVSFQRTASRQTSYLDHSAMDREVPLREVTFKNLRDNHIEDQCGKSLMVDFANRMLGGGVLRNGCVQEEILFAIFPEAIVSKLLCEAMEDEEAIIMYGLRRYSFYKGYAETFQFDGEFPVIPSNQAELSIMVAIDAIDFSHHPSPNYQYCRKGVRRQINKAYAGFNGAGYRCQQEVGVCSGKWGCGAFGGDEDLKFLIQWIAASEAGRQLIYITDSQSKIEDLLRIKSELIGHCTLDVLSILDEYYRCRGKTAHPPTLLNYIKEYVI